MLLSTVANGNDLQSVLTCWGTIASISSVLVSAAVHGWNVNNRIKKGTNLDISRYLSQSLMSLTGNMDSTISENMILVGDMGKESRSEV